ncbi:hypothetical protein O6H91_07G076900 [Diphasiastrum complanatum]|uniref:Uncharacterized protein n=1 Tax=Diphasiastrum complanatum TaxID=34168 RepID=A0ACC2D6Z3_DIPCM|nr:hypothetical protein O6H91_07G076900 [Diphasiastrum complanatum]
MAIFGINLKWFDGFFLSMLATTIIVVSIDWNGYRVCEYPLHIWLVVDYAVVFGFRLLIFVDHGLTAATWMGATPTHMLVSFYGRMLVLSCLAIVMYPFLWAWTVIGTLWFTSAGSCLPEEGQKWGFLIWLLFSYCGLISVACISASKWLIYRQAHQFSPRGTMISELRVLAELIRAPERTIQASPSSQDPQTYIREMRIFHVGHNVMQNQKEAVESLIQQLPKFPLTGISSESNVCSICLDELETGTEVRGLPCAHNFHVDCIDQWLRLNVKCPHCRFSVFPQINLPENSNLGINTAVIEYIA